MVTTPDNEAEYVRTPIQFTELSTRFSTEEFALPTRSMYKGECTTTVKLSGTELRTLPSLVLGGIIENQNSDFVMQ
jgi:hypothetical protein